MRKCLLGILLAAGCGQPIQGSGRLKTNTIPAVGAKTVKFFGIGELHIRQSSAEALNITTDDNLQTYLDSRLQGDVLTLDQKSGSRLSPSKTIDYQLSLKEPDTVEWSGAGMLSLSNIKAARLVLLGKGAGQIRLTDIQVDQLTLDLAGASSVVASGEVKNFSVQSSGSGHLQTKALRAEAVTLDLSGTGNAVVNATTTLDAKLSGVGSITYFGNAKVNKAVTGVGTINPG